MKNHGSDCQALGYKAVRSSYTTTASLATKEWVSSKTQVDEPAFLAAIAAAESLSMRFFLFLLNMTSRGWRRELSCSRCCYRKMVSRQDERNRERDERATENAITQGRTQEISVSRAAARHKQDARRQTSEQDYLLVQCGLSVTCAAKCLLLTWKQ